MDKIIITNNPIVYERFSKKYNVEYLEGQDYLTVLKKARDRIHLGFNLKTHPLSGSIKPNETPYKSLVISKVKANLDLRSIYVIEDSIQVTKKFLNDNKLRNYSDKIFQDFQVIDFELIRNAMDSMESSYCNN